MHYSINKPEAWCLKMEASEAADQPEVCMVSFQQTVHLQGNSVANSRAWRKDRPQINTPRLKTLGETWDRDHAMSTGEDMLMQLKLFCCG